MAYSSPVRRGWSSEPIFSARPINTRSRLTQSNSVAWFFGGGTNEPTIEPSVRRRIASAVRSSIGTVAA